MDREKVIKALSICFPETQDDANLECSDCPYGDVCNPNDIVGLTLPLIWDIRALLKEQEAVKPVLDEQTGRMWLCGNCGSYVGFEDNDPHDPNEFDKYCRECGRPVLWEGR